MIPTHPPWRNDPSVFHRVKVAVRAAEYTTAVGDRGDEKSIRRRTAGPSRQGGLAPLDPYSIGKLNPGLRSDPTFVASRGLGLELPGISPLSSRVLQRSFQDAHEDHASGHAGDENT